METDILNRDSLRNKGWIDHKNYLFLIHETNTIIKKWLWMTRSELSWNLNDKNDNFLLQRDLKDNTLLLADKKFPDLMSIVEALRDDVLLENCSQLLTNPCPGLPLNALFTGYEKATGRRGGRWRGRQLRQSLFKILCYLIEGALSLVLSALASYGALARTILTCEARLTAWDAFIICQKVLLWL